MHKPVIIIGAGGHAKVIADIVLKNDENLLGFLDDNKEINTKVIGYPILGQVSEIDKYIDKAYFVIGIGSNLIRKRLDEQYNLDWYTAIHPSASIAVDTVIEKGTVVMANAVINTSAKIGKHCIINTSAVIEHDNNIADYVHVSPHVTLCGTVSVGEMTHIGAGATVINNLNITSNSIIGAGAVVVKNITEAGTYVGVPAKKL